MTMPMRLLHKLLHLTKQVPFIGRIINPVSPNNTTTNDALHEVVIIRIPQPDTEDERVEYIRNNGNRSVKVTIRQSRSVNHHHYTSWLVFNNLLPGEEQELGYAGHGIENNTPFSSEHLIVAAEYVILK